MGDISSQETPTGERESLAEILDLEKKAVGILETNKSELSNLLRNLSDWKETNGFKEGGTAYYRCGVGGKTTILKVSSPEKSSYAPIADEFNGVEQLIIEQTGGGQEKVVFYWNGKPDVSWKSPDDNFSGLICVGPESFSPVQPNEGVDIYGFRGNAPLRSNLFGRDFPLLGTSYWSGSYSESKNRSFVHKGGDAVKKGKEILDTLLETGSVKIRV